MKIASQLDLFETVYTADQLGNGINVISFAQYKSKQAYHCLIKKETKYAALSTL